MSVSWRVIKIIINEINELIAIKLTKSLCHVCLNLHLFSTSMLLLLKRNLQFRLIAGRTSVSLSITGCLLLFSKSLISLFQSQMAHPVLYLALNLMCRLGKKVDSEIFRILHTTQIFFMELLDLTHDWFRRRELGDKIQKKGAKIKLRQYKQRQTKKATFLHIRPKRFYFFPFQIGRRKCPHPCIISSKIWLKFTPFFWAWCAAQPSNLLVYLW